MFPLVMVVVVFTILLKYLRSKVIQHQTSFYEDFTPDYSKAYEKFGKQREERQKHWAKEEKQKLKNAEKYGHFSNFDKEMEYIRAKTELEKKHPIRKRSTYEGAFALVEIRKQERERNILLDKMKKEIFERETGDDSQAQKE